MPVTKCASPLDVYVVYYMRVRRWIDDREQGSARARENREQKEGGMCVRGRRRWTSQICRKRGA
eukprot:3702806-Pleurochrysis_carterae.AAC.3